MQAIFQWVWSIIILLYMLDAQAKVSPTSQPPSGVIINIDASTGSVVKEKLQTDQSALQKAHQNLENIKNTVPSNVSTLRPENSLQASVLEGLIVITLVKSIAVAANPWLLPGYVLYRGIWWLAADSGSFIDQPTSKQAEDLARDGKQKVTTVRLDPVVHAFCQSVL